MQCQCLYVGHQAKGLSTLSEIQGGVLLCCSCWFVPWVCQRAASMSYWQRTMPQSPCLWARPFCPTYTGLGQTSMGCQSCRLSPAVCNSRASLYVRPQPCTKHSCVIGLKQPWDQCIACMLTYGFVPCRQHSWHPWSLPCSVSVPG